MSSYINPAEFGIRESGILHPETAPHLVVSIGNGASQPGSEVADGGPNLGNDPFIVRAYQSLCNNLNPRRAWKKLLSHHSVAADCEFFRFDPEFDGPEPELESVKDMGMVRETASQAALHAPTLPKLKQHIYAELFYFELISLSSQDNGFLCQGQILCRFDTALSELDALVSHLAQEDATFTVKNYFIPIDPPQGPSSKSIFCRKIKFRVSSREEQFHVVLNEDRQATPISGSPFTLAHLIKVQQLDCWFGRTGCREMALETDSGPILEDKNATNEPVRHRRANRRKRVAEVDSEPKSVKYRRISGGSRRRAR